MIVNQRNQTGKIKHINKKNTMQFNRILFENALLKAT